jgi:6-phosphofructokinase 1
MEVIGRNAGWTAASSILARKRPGDAPHLIYVPEVPFSRQRFLASVEQVYSQYGWVVVVVSEGLLDEKGDPIGQSGDETIKDGFGHRLAGEVGASLAQLVSQEIGLRARSEKPGLIARASSLHVSKVDRNAAEGVGRFAVRNVCQGSTDFMAAICRDNDEPLEMSYIGVPLEKTANFERLLPNCYISESKSDIEDSFRSYVRPLIGQALTRHPSLIE